MAETTNATPEAGQHRADVAKARAKGFAIHGCRRRCRRCGGTAYHAGTARWQNRVVCLDCGHKWSE